MKISELRSLNSECFSISNHEMNWWNIFTDNNAYELSLENSWIMRQVKQYAIGYCNGDKVLFRPSNYTYAVMFEKDGIDFWFHINKSTFDEEFINCPKCGYYPYKEGWICEQCQYSK